jgi:ankyrin repeat protein
MSSGNWKEMFDAALTGDLALVKYHIKEGVEVDYVHPEYLSTTLVACIVARQEKVAQFLLDRGANPQLLSVFEGQTPIQAAYSTGQSSLVARLVALGAPMPEVDKPHKAKWWTFWH